MTTPTSPGTIPIRTPQLLPQVAKVAQVLKMRDMRNVIYQASHGYGVLEQGRRLWARTMIHFQMAATYLLLNYTAFTTCHIGICKIALLSDGFAELKNPKCPSEMSTYSHSTH